MLTRRPRSKRRTRYGQRGLLRRAARVESLEPRLVLDSTVVFSEVMYNPPDGQQLEWIELHSEMAVDMDLSGWRIDGVGYTFPAGTIIPSGEYLVIAKSPSELQIASGFGDALGPYTGQLSNGGERLRLINNSNRVMDELDFLDHGEWPVGADGSGATLSKVNPDGGSKSAENWATSTQVGGTPGVENFSSGPLVGPTTTILPIDATWRFDDSGADFGASWLAANFDPDDPNNDGSNSDAWGSGPALLGNEDGTLPFPLATNLSLGATTYYFRTEFSFSGDPAATQLKLNPIVDDGAVFYLNGQEVARINMPNGPIDFLTPASAAVRNAKDAGAIVISAADLVTGTNVLAVEVHQAAEDTVIAAEAVIVNNGGLELVEEGPVAATAGDPAPVNLATGAVPFALDELDFGGIHTIDHLNDGQFGNAFSWIGNGATGPSGAFVGINLGANPITLASIAFGRSNVLAGDACGGICTDRSLGLYRLQFTTVPNPDETTPDANWIEIGTLDYQSPGGDDFAFPHRRHRYNFDPVMATGIRLIVPATGLNGGTAIDEIELYDLPLEPPPPANVLAITPEPRFTIHWNGNDGDNFDPAPPPGGAVVPDNAALASNGAVPFSSSDLGPELGIGFHVQENLNDGFYGNSNSWIGGDSNPFAPAAFGGVAFNNLVPIKRIAWGRDNGNGQFDDSQAGTDACGGQCDDRSTGTYRLQYTTVASPDQDTADTGDAATGSATIGALAYNSSQDTMPGGGFTSYLRHEYDVRLDAGPINATGIRIVVPSTGLGGGTGIDEIEVYTDDFVPAIAVDPAPGFSIVWNGNDGDHSNPNDPALAPDNLVLSTPGMAVFGSGEAMPGAIDAVADGFYGDASSWTSDGALPAFVGLGFGESLTFDHVAFGRDNGNDTDPDCPGGECTDDALGGYTIQITTLGNPGPATADTGSRSTGWETVGRVVYNESSDTFTPHLRHEFIVLDGGQAITATGLRIVVSDPGLTIDEIELSLTPEPSPVVIEAAAGFGITWDGNDGEFFDPSPDAAVPENLALASSGTTPFASGELGTQIGLPYHLVENLNDGLYGNGRSWIGGSADNPLFAGLDLGGLVEIDRVAWGRDNGRLTPSGEECGGACTDRALGLYTLQYTTVASPGISTADTGNADTGWQTVGQIDYDFEEDNVVGGGFTAYLRHEFAVRENGGLLGATGIRLLLPAGTAIDELEVYGPEDPDVAFAATLTATEILPDPAEIVISEVAAATAATFWLEIGNQNPQSVDLTGYVLASSDANKTPYVLPAQLIAGNGFVHISLAEFGFDVVEGERLFLFGPGQATLADAVIVDAVSRARSIDHGGRWLVPDVATPGGANSFAVEQDIVINEIFYHAPGTATSDVPATFTSTTLVPIDADTEWRYRDVASGLPNDWATTAHNVGVDDWKTGPGLIGFETASLSDPIRTPVSNPPATFPFVVTYYFEREFELTNDFNNVNLEVAINHYVDDGAVFYVNGSEFLRVNMTSGPFDATTFAASGTGNAAKSEPVVIPKELLVEGTNRISVEVHQASASSSDVVFGAEIIERQIITPFEPGIPFTESDEEWIELYNRSSTRTVDLTGWSLADAVEFEFPSGVIIGPGQFLLVARDANELQTQRPTLNNIVGEYGGTLSNTNETIRLLDAIGNPADTVEYFDHGRWSELADGGGSSLELRDPFADNNKPESWAASDETGDTGWQTITYRGLGGSDGFNNGVTNRFHEFILGLLDAGEVLIDDISVVEDPDGAAIERIQNGTFDSDTLGAGPDKWRINGNHRGIVVLDPMSAANQVLRLTATGVWEDRYNHAETTFVDNATIREDVEYAISLRAKWLSGSNQLNSHLYFNRLARTTLLERTNEAGTPGGANSIGVANFGPTYDGLAHFPVVPNANQPVTVSVTAEDPNGVDMLSLWYKVDNGDFQNIAMNGLGDGVYQGLIPGQGSSRIVQFYVEGVDTLGSSSFFPAGGPDSRALYIVQDGQAASGGLHNFRIVMTPADTTLLHERTNTMSNERLGTTIVYNESEVFYDAGVRLKGSNAGRNNAAFLSFNVAFDPTQLFRGVHDSVAIDRSGRSGPTPQAQDEILIKHIANHAGDTPHMYDDLVRVIAPNQVHTRTALLMMARYGDEFLDTQYENGADGTVFKLDIAYVPNGTTNGAAESPKVQFPYSHPQPTKDLQDLGENKEAYRAHLLIRNNRDADNFRGIIAAAQTLSLNGSELAAAAPEVIDVDQWARVFAVQSLTGAADVYTRGGLHHNINFYVRPGDGRVLALPWDWDFAFTGSTSQALIGGTGNGGKLMTLPGISRLVHGHMLDIINTTFNNAYLDRWIDHYGAVAGQSFGPIKGYISARRDFVLSRLPDQIPFEITTNGGADLTAVARSIELSGRGWIDVREIQLAGTGESLEVQWLDDQNWRITLPLTDGDNVVNLSAMGHQGQLVGSDSIVITSFIPNPITESLRITEINYNPAAPTEAEMAQIADVDDDDFEFLELQNVGENTINLTGVHFDNGVNFTFGSVDLTAGERIVLVKDLAAFQLRYGTEINVGGEYSGSLSDGGERISLDAVDGTSILEFSYSDEDPWPERADSTGGTLEISDAAGTPADQYGKYYRWRGSTEFGGSPGLAGAGPIGIVVNEVLSHTDPPETPSDSIELFNTTDGPIDIGGWFLSDAANRLLKFQIPAGTTLGAGGYITFDEEDFNPTPLNPGPNDFALSSAHGDDVWLVIADGAGGVASFVDEVHFGAAANGESFGRVSNATGLLAPNTRATLGCRNSGARVGPVIISEIHHTPSAPIPAAEALGVTVENLQFVEILNPTPDPIVLTNWRIRGGIQYDFPAGTMLGQEPVILVSFDPTSAENADLLEGFALHHGIENRDRVQGGFAGRLSNAGELVELQRPDEPPLDEPDFIPYVIADSVLYDTVAPWPGGDATAGISIERIAPVFYGGTDTSWRASTGTPGSIDFSAAIAGDFTGEGVANAADIDALYDAITRESNVEYFDLDGNSSVDQADVTFLVQSILQTFMGDANLDGQVNAVDLNQIGINWQAANCVGWGTGDFSGDGKVNATDLNFLGINWQNGVAQAAEEPNLRTPRAALPAMATRSAEIVDIVFARQALKHASSPASLDDPTISAAQRLHDSSDVQGGGGIRLRRLGKRFGLGQQNVNDRTAHDQQIEEIEEVFARLKWKS